MATKNRKSFLKATGSNTGINGAGSRGTSRPKLRPNTGKSMSVKSVPSTPTRGIASPTRNIKRT